MGSSCVGASVSFVLGQAGPGRAGRTWAEGAAAPAAASGWGPEVPEGEVREAGRSAEGTGQMRRPGAGVSWGQQVAGYAGHAGSQAWRLRAMTSWAPASCSEVLLGRCLLWAPSTTRPSLSPETLEERALLPLGTVPGRPWARGHQALPLPSHTKLQ